MSLQKGIIKRDRVRVDEAPTVLAASGAGKRSAPAPRPHEPVARLVRLDGRVSAVELTCACGEVTLIEFEVDDAAKTAEESR